MVSTVRQPRNNKTVGISNWSGWEGGKNARSQNFYNGIKLFPYYNA